MSKTPRLDSLRARLDANTVVFDGLDAALLGVGICSTRIPLLVYDRDLILEILVSRDGMTPEEAEDFCGDNIDCLWAGEGTPVLLSPFFEGEDTPFEDVFADLDDALVGAGTQHSTPTVPVYDRDLVFRVLTEGEGMSPEAAETHFALHVEGAKWGDKTPLVLYRAEVEAPSGTSDETLDKARARLQARHVLEGE